MTYLDDLLIITKSNFHYHLTQVGTELPHLQGASVRVSTAKTFFVEAKIEYLGYMLMLEGIKPQPEKVSAILAIRTPTTIKELREFLGMIQYCRDLWKKQSHLLVPLTDLVGECGHTKVTRKNKTKKKSWH